MKQQRGLHFHADPTIRMFGRALPFDPELIVDAFDAGQAFDGILGQRLVGTFVRGLYRLGVSPTGKIPNGVPLSDKPVGEAPMERPPARILVP